MIDINTNSKHKLSCHLLTYTRTFIILFQYYKNALILEILRISRISRTSNTCGWDALEWSDGSDYLVVGRGLYLKDYEFLECHEWWTERETVQPEKGESAFFFIIEQEIMTEKG